MALTPIQPQVDSSQLHNGPQRVTDIVRNLTLKASLVSTTESFESAVKERPQELLFRAAIDKLNEALETELGTQAIENAASSGMDFSPEAVADRIVGFATAFFGKYQENHDGEGQEEQLSGFSELIRGAIQQGFEEARDILEGLGVFSGEIKDNANRTYDLIQEKLDAFEQQKREEFSV